MNILILFSGTKSFSNNFKEHNVRSLDIDKKFKPYYRVDILNWDYKKDLEDFKVDYLHASPVCCHFSSLNEINKKTRNYKPNVELGYKLVDKSIEIIEWIKENQNPSLKFTIENPKNKKTLNYEPLKKYKYKITSYCKYGFKYQKDTTFWYGGFNLILKDKCKKGFICNSKKETGENYHKVVIAFNHKERTKQLRDSVWFKTLKKQERYKNFNDREMRYRIPDQLIEDIKKSLDL